MRDLLKIPKIRFLEWYYGRGKSISCDKCKLIDAGVTPFTMRCYSCNSTSMSTTIVHMKLNFIDPLLINLEEKEEIMI